MNAKILNCSDILPQCKRSFLVVEDAVKGNKMHVLQWIETNLSHRLLAELQQDKSYNHLGYYSKWFLKDDEEDEDQLVLN